MGGFGFFGCCRWLFRVLHLGGVVVWCVLGFCCFTEFGGFLWVGVIQVSGFAAGLGCMGCLEFVGLRVGLRYFRCL